MEGNPLRMFEGRRYEMIPLDRIVVLNTRSRCREHFQENIDSIKNVGLLKPIVVNVRKFKKTGTYDLVCGEGRYLAHKELGRTEILAEVINCDDKKALLYSLVENIARVPPNTIWFASEIKRMADAGWTYVQIGKVVGKHESYVADYVRLVEQGEDRLIRGVEQGIFPITFAMHVAKSNDSNIQDVLMQAFDKKLINTASIQTVRKVIEQRFKHGKNIDPRIRSTPHKKINIKELKTEIAKVTSQKEAFVNEGQAKESRIYMLIDGINTLWKNEEFLAILEKERLNKVPQLQGNYKMDTDSPFGPAPATQAAI